MARGRRLAVGPSEIHKIFSAFRWECELFYGRRHADAASAAGKMPAAQSKDSFVYDPANAVPTIGGPLCCRGDLVPPGRSIKRGGGAEGRIGLFDSGAGKKISR